MVGNYGGKKEKEKDLRDSLLSPVQITLNFFGGSHAISKVSLGGLETTLSQGLQFLDFSVLGV